MITDTTVKQTLKNTCLISVKIGIIMTGQFRSMCNFPRQNNRNKDEE